MNVVLNANVDWDEYDFELEAGVIDHTARWVFTHGQCHSLALALHEQTGWNVVGIGGYGEDDLPGHVAVEDDNGFVIDIDGRWTVREWQRAYGGCYVQLDPYDAYNAFDDMYREPDVMAASYWVEPVLAQAAARINTPTATTEQPDIEEEVYA